MYAVLMLGTGTQFDWTIAVVTFAQRRTTDTYACRVTAIELVTFNVAEMNMGHLHSERMGTVTRARK